MATSRAAARALRATQAAEELARAEITAAAKADAFVRKFVEMTPAQVTSWIGANVNSLAEAKTLLTKMALMLLLLARREFKD